MYTSKYFNYLPVQKEISMVVQDKFLHSNSLNKF